MSQVAPQTRIAVPVSAPSMTPQSVNLLDVFSQWLDHGQLVSPNPPPEPLRRLDLWGSQIGFGYAACVYSLISPPRIGRR
jgi:hypothetical protein